MYDVFSVADMKTQSFLLTLGDLIGVERLDYIHGLAYNNFNTFLKDWLLEAQNFQLHIIFDIVYSL